MAGERARFRRDALLQTAIARQANDVLIENLVLGGIESRRRHFRRHGHADRVTDALAERTGRAFDPGVSKNSGWPGVLLCSCRNRLISSIGKS